MSPMRFGLTVRERPGLILSKQDQDIKGYSGSRCEYVLAWVQKMEVITPC
jgi:hypothetical protein